MHAGTLVFSQFMEFLPRHEFHSCVRRYGGVRCETEIRRLWKLWSGGQIPDAACFVTCNHCGSSLEIKQTADVIYSEKIAQIDERTGRIEQQLQRLQLENELTALDLAWEKSRQQFMVSDKHGNKHVPTKSEAWTMGCLGGGAGLFGIVVGTTSAEGGSMVLLCMSVMTVCVCLALSTLGKAGEYDAAERRYRQIPPRHFGPFVRTPRDEFSDQLNVEMI